MKTKITFEELAAFAADNLPAPTDFAGEDFAARIRQAERIIKRRNSVPPKAPQ